MAKFIIRIQLEDADFETYSMLHKLMYSKGFTRSIKLENPEKLYMLPDAEYYYDGVIEDIDSIKKTVEIVVKSTNKENKILITKAQDIVAVGLKRVIKLN